MECASLQQAFFMSRVSMMRCKLTKHSMAIASWMVVADWTSNMCYTWIVENNAPEVFDKVPKMMGCETNCCRAINWKSGVHVGHRCVRWPIKSLYIKTNKVLTHVGGVSLFLEPDWEVVKAAQEAQRRDDKFKVPKDDTQQELLSQSPQMGSLFSIPLTSTFTVGFKQYISQDKPIRNLHMIELENDQNTHFNDSKGKFVVTNEFSDESVCGGTGFGPSSLLLEVAKSGLEVADS